jgi:glycosyltransferase involved in cell wall biosynthesis
MVVESWGRGGTETYVRELALALGRRHPVQVVRLRESTEASPFPFAKGGSQHVDDAAAPGWRSVVRRLRAAQGGIVHLHLYSTLLPVVLLVKMFSTSRIVTTFHMPLKNWNRRHRMAWRLAARMSDACAGVSFECLDSFGRTLEGKPTAVIPPPLPTELFAAGERAQPQPTGALTIAGSGRLAHEKDWPTLLCAVAALQSRGRSVTLRLYGDGYLRRELEGQARDVGLDPKQVFAGYLPREALLAELRAADLFVLPSRFEGLGISAIEAMAIGLPTITANFPASIEYIRDGETGTRFPRGDWRALADQIAWHIDHPERAAAIAQKGRTFVLDRFSPENTFARYMELYEACA